jgi:hypothetical protein
MRPSGRDLEIEIRGAFKRIANPLHRPEIFKSAVCRCPA